MGLGLAPLAQAATVAVSPSSAHLSQGGKQHFAAGSAVTWLVNGIPGGAPAIGLIDANGNYAAPADVARALEVEVEAQSVSDPLSNGSAAVSLAAGVASPGRAVFVAPTGSDTNDGSKAHPWKTIQHAVGKVPVGGTVNVASGIYPELVTIARSGSAKAGFITLTAAPGAKPVIDGTGLKIPNGQNGLITLTNASYVRVIGFELRNYVSDKPNLDPVGIYVTGAGDAIEILGNHIHDIRTTGKTENFDALGIAIYGTRAPAALTRLVIDGNELDHLVTGFSESLALSGNVQYWQVTGNTIHDNNNIGIDVGGYEKFAPKAACDRARNGTVAGNTVYNITSLHNPAYHGQQSADGIYVDGGADVVVERNLVHHADLGIEVASEHSGRTSDAVTVRSNIVYASNQVGISIGGYGAGVGGASNAVIVNNTLYGNGAHANSEGEFQIQFHATGNLFENNIAAADNAQNLLLYSFVPTPAHPATLDYNLYDAPGGAGNSNWYWLNKGYSTFAAYKSKTGNDPHSAFADPKFTAPSAANFHLKSGSPALNAGKVLPLSAVGLYDFAGKPRIGAQGKIDLGAYQD
jgi:hypothetical protein